MTNLHIHSVIQQAFTYQIHSIIFIFWICLQIFEFLTFHFLMEILSHKMSKIGLILFWHKSAPYPTFPVSGNKNANWWLRNLCLSWLSPSPSPLTFIQQLISMAFASCKLWNPSPRALLWSGSHLLLGGPHRLTLASPSDLTSSSVLHITTRASLLKFTSNSSLPS